MNQADSLSENTLEQANAHFEIEHLDATTSTQSCTGNDTDSDGDTNMDTGNRIEPSFQINSGLRDRVPINSRHGPNDVSEILDATADSSYEDSGDGNRTSENDSEADQDSEEYDNNFADGDGTLEATNGDNTYEDGAFFNNNQEWDDAQPSV
ncbi:AT-rich interactive domain-containing protein 2 [Frankliniella fusca]|uniref:AT-rich interactive domain-containing protein 2 n=1 Tax=Frankliniella fusca TaxID=407009 RepID=A0AAE1LQU1_9NEOP|nr:AT-rich interactive domain-containing protein 2 [Frankliniella fusca]